MSKKKDTATILSFQRRRWIRPEKSGFTKRWFNGVSENSKLWPWLFFLTSLIFRDKHTFAALCWLWAAITPVKKIVRPKSTTFSETSGRELSHGPILEKFSHQKISRRRVFSKNRRFLQFFVSAPKKISNGCQSDNFDPRRSAHGSSERSWPEFSETHAEKVSIFKIVGASPLQSQVIQNRVRQNSCFLGNFWEKMVSHGQTVDFRQ